MQLKRELIVLDLETTGTWVEKDKIIEIALIRLCPSGEEHTYEQRVNPGMPIPPEVTKLVGISNADVQDAPYFREIVLDVLEFIGEADLAGYNVERFDLPLLERECFQAGHKFEWQRRAIYDAQKVYHLNEKRDLTAAYKYYCGKDLINAHSALADTQATAAILAAQVSKYLGEDSPVEALGQFKYSGGHDFADPDRRFRWWNGEVYPMFGKYAKRLNLREIVRKDPDYLHWILNADFNDEIKDLVEKALQGQFPIKEEESSCGSKS